ncbi:beta-D-galactosidase [Amycolatopsis pithecellobii]|uniref:Cupin domain-containing protein n=1 Tax=Amycolatopsis pithecellobii TaxID=664692 RepID=A0A6N7YPB4_9PSEU|nr:cupin domain-containing protein [Amycolatopsis pithecellobii]MTD53852.1 cupin domain-containing protein [Amycolatopsis pithecellobii]
MRVTRADSAPTYDPPLHRGVTALRLQGLEAGLTNRFWVGLSRYGPDGMADMAPTVEETVYIVLSGELVVSVDEGDVTLRALDSAHLPKGTVRRVANRSGQEATLLVAIALPPEATP